MNKRKETLLVGALLVGVLGVPVAMAAYMLAGGPVAPVLQLAATAPVDGSTAAGANRSSSLVAGVLYTNGKATVDWNGVNLPIEDGIYAYVGGEVVTTEPGSMATLRLPGGDMVYICPETRIRLVRDDAGRYSLEVGPGTSRFVFASGTPFEVHANETVVSPAPGADPGVAFVGEVKAYKDSGCLVCALQNNVQVKTVSSDGSASAAAALVGHFIDVPGPADADGAAGAGPIALAQSPIPPDVLGQMQAGLQGAGGPGTDYLCRCEDLKRYADAGQQVAQAGSTLEPPEADDSTVPESAPPVAPPDTPVLVLAEPGAPAPFDPNALPAPAAGPAPASTLTVVAPPPAVPAGGSGGGFLISGA